MRELQVGDFKVDAWQGGYPVWCEISYGDVKLKCRHTELAHLEFAISELRKMARDALPDSLKHEA